MNLDPSFQIHSSYRSKWSFPFFQKIEHVTIKSDHLPDIIAESHRLREGQPFPDLRIWVKVEIQETPFFVKIEDLKRQHITVPENSSPKFLEEVIHRRKEILFNLMNAGNW